MGAVPGSPESHGQGSGGAKSQSYFRFFFVPSQGFKMGSEWRDRDPGRWR